MIRRASLSPFVAIAFVLALAAPAVRAAPQGTELPADGQNALKNDFDKWSPVWAKLLAGQEVADPANAQHQQAVDAAARWYTYRLTWGLEKEGKITDVYREFVDNLQLIRAGKDKTAKLGEMYAKAVIPHALEVLQAGPPIARVNAARMLARLPEKANDESPADVLARLGGNNQADLADALATAIKDPNQIDAARYWAFRALRLLLNLPQAMPPALPPAKEQAALGEVVKYLQTHNKPLPPGTPDDEIDGFRMVRREAIMALAAGHFPTLTALPDKPQPAWVLLKIACRDGVEPEPRTDERVEAAIGVARAQPALDPAYQPDYAAHQLGLFVVDFLSRYVQEKQAAKPDQLPSEPWKVEASRLIEALEFMKAQAKNDAHVTLVVDQCLPALQPIEKALPPPNPSDLEQKLRGTASPNQQLYKGVPESTVRPANRKGADAPEEKKEEKKDK
jgi:hypothetical protein